MKKDFPGPAMSDWTYPPSCVEPFLAFTNAKKRAEDYETLVYKGCNPWVSMCPPLNSNNEVNTHYKLWKDTEYYYNNLRRFGCPMTSTWKLPWD
jgi:hypothetical protein